MMVTRPIAITIRSKKLGVLMRSARLASGKSLEDCANTIGLPYNIIEAYEKGEASPSLPELEAFAFSLKVPLEHFWGREVISVRKSDNGGYDFTKLLRIRQRIIGTLLRQARQDSGLSTQELSEKVGLPEGDISAYEFGRQPIPLPELEMLATVLNRPIKEFQDSRGPIGIWASHQRAMQHFSELTPELQEFISKPVNRPYLELALRLSEMSVEKLRSVAEGLLEITL